MFIVLRGVGAVPFNKGSFFKINIQNNNHGHRMKQVNHIQTIKKAPISGSF